ncbi:MAG TPA: ImmA/IrrE family metallo-endopeptidase [Chloroflexota bacterium]
MKGYAWKSMVATVLVAQTGAANAGKAMEQSVQQLLAEADQTEPPCHLALVASCVGIKKILPVTMSSAARLLPQADHLEVQINAKHPQGKRRFSVAHEICHTLLPTYYRTFVDDRFTGQFSNKSEEELLCDIGAASLLMPESWLRTRTAGVAPGIEALASLSAQFDVSLEAMALRLSELAVWPCGFVFWQEGLRKADQVPLEQGLLEGFERPVPKPRVHHVYCSSSFATFVPKNKSAPDDSLVAACFQSEQSTVGVDVFDFGKGPLPFYCEHLYAPYKPGEMTVPRVISVLMAAQPQAGSPVEVPSSQTISERLFTD